MTTNTDALNSIEARKARVAWFQAARFGMFIHWGAYSVPGRGEWVQHTENIPQAEYQTFVDAFKAEDYDPRRWAKEAKAAGMKYAVLTAKHHDGFALFDTKLSTYSSMHNGIGRDLVREYVDAFRAEGIRVGLYFSIIDWSRQDFLQYAYEPLPPAGTPERAECEAGWATYLEFMHGQVREICSNYGTLDVLWFDFAFEHLTGEAWRATELVNLVRSLQPGVLIDNRLEGSGSGFGSIVTDSPTVYAGDFASPEQIIPDTGIRNDAGEPLPWESCITMNNNWGYCTGDNVYKPTRTLVRKLVECVAKGGNLLLNIGPDAAGLVPTESSVRLAEIGAWMQVHGESIYGASAATQYPKPDWGYYTAKDNIVYAHIFEQPIGPLALTGISQASIASITNLTTGEPCKIGNEWVGEAYPTTAFAQLGPVEQYTYLLPNDIDTVLKIELKS